MTPSALALLLTLTAMADDLVTGVEPVVVTLGAGGCVDRPGLVEQIEARAGKGSVVDDGPRVVDVAFAGAFPEVFVTLTLDVAGQRSGTRRIGPFVDCPAAVDATALAIALVIDPFGPPPSPPSPPSPPPPASPLRPVEVVRRAPQTPPFGVGLGAGVGVGSGFGVVPGPMGLVRLRLDAGVIPVVIGLGGRVDVPAPLVIDGRRHLESVGGAFFVEGCHRSTPSVSTMVDSCVVGQAGGLRGTGVGFDNAIPTTARLIGAGLAFTLRTDLGAGLGAFARVVVDTPVLRARLVADGLVYWESPPVTGLLVVGLDGLATP